MKKYFTIVVCLQSIICFAQAPYPSAPPAPGNITNIEYFIDSIQSFGSGTPLAGFTSSVNVSNFSTTVNLAGVPGGVHRIYFRSKDADSKWSLTNTIFFDNYNLPVYPSATAATNIVQVEYFIDGNQNFGSGIPITGFIPSANVSNYSAALSLTGVPNGIHNIYFRSKGADGKWSLTNALLFDNYNLPVYPSAAAVINIVQLEYFIDNNDLGFGNCTPISIAPNSNIANLNANINITGLVQGVHRLFIRSKDANGKWSLTNFSVFDNSAVQAYPSAPAAAPAISNMEYFIDNDPGFGNATPFTIPGNTGDVNNYSVSLNLSGALSVGTHYLYIRSKQNPWSLTNIVPFSATITLPVDWLFVKAQVVNNQTNISWATAQETNTNKYEVEHSVNGTVFTKIGEVTAAGNSSTRSDYNFIHNHPETGFNYYRIKQIDRDGNFKYSMVIAVFKKDGLKQTIIAPNPVKDMLNVVEPAKTFIRSVAIYSVNGALLLQKEINNTTQVFSLPVNNLASGSYLLQVNYKDESKAYQFIKE